MNLKYISEILHPDTHQNSTAEQAEFYNGLVTLYFLGYCDLYCLSQRTLSKDLLLKQKEAIWGHYLIVCNWLSLKEGYFS